MHWATQSVEKQLRRLGSVEILSDHVMVRCSKMESHEPPVSVSVSPGEMLRLLVKQRVHAAVEESSGLLDTLTAAYEDTVSQLREHERRASDVQQLVGIKPDVPPEDQDKEEPEPLLIKEELQDLWTRLEGDQLIVLEEADITKFLSTAVTLKSEDDEPQTSRLHQSQTEDNKEAEGRIQKNYDNSPRADVHVDSRSDATQHIVKIVVVRGNDGEDPVEVSILLEGEEMLAGCGSMPKLACC
ncbi:uncharacterized protein LOC130198346 [Pseudoliparis swirei]|uniref:uncharacterized protein LOC130198346 n=1 Tax=Pseudoliparis swirei TaxID=2059687 RepID=UPI0024BE85DE|nr:uncharacterized protein LOC130198346 [Pseudoliparis swirei]